MRSPVLLASTMLVLAATCCVRPSSADDGEYYRGPAMITLNDIDCNFNGTAIPAGRTIWFNSIVKPQFSSALPVTIFFRHQIISFTAGVTPYTMSVPDAAVTFDPAGGTAT